jgi:hypothetical protein
VLEPAKRAMEKVKAPLSGSLHIQKACTSGSFPFKLFACLCARHVLLIVVHKLEPSQLVLMMHLIWQLSSHGQWKYPTCFLTNGGGVTEAQKAQQLSSLLDAPVTEQQGGPPFFSDKGP